MEFDLPLLPELRGPAISCLIALYTAEKPVTELWLSEKTGYGINTVGKGLQTLRRFGLIRQVTLVGKWALTSRNVLEAVIDSCSQPESTQDSSRLVLKNCEPGGINTPKKCEFFAGTPKNCESWEHPSLQNIDPVEINTPKKCEFFEDTPKNCESWEHPSLQISDPVEINTPKNC